MKNMERIRDRYLKEPLPQRLGGLAASLARISSSARRSSGAAEVAVMLEECRYFIEWTAAGAEPEAAADMVDIQLLLTMWCSAWSDAQKIPAQRMILSVLAKGWSDRVLDYSGLAQS